MRTLVIALLALVGLLASQPAPARASGLLADVNVTAATIAVNRAGLALVGYTREDGRRRHVLVWGAVNARKPDPNVRQVRFRVDYSGGFGAFRRPVWKTFRNACRPYDGPAVPYYVAGCKAPDGSYWALQSWQRLLPLLGFDPWLPAQDDYELHVSHWSGDLARLDVYTNWTYGGSFQGLFGRLTYDGSPVYGFGTAKSGNPLDRYARTAYMDTFDSAYGPGWRREAGVVFHRPTGTFCHSFVPQRPFPGYPSSALRPAAPGERYRVTVVGPGVTPDVQWEGRSPGRYDAAADARVNEVFDRVMAGDRICAPER